MGISLEEIVNMAVKSGADEAHVTYVESRGYSVAINIGEISDVIWRHSRVLELIVIKDKKIGVATTNDLSTSSIDDLIKRALNMANSSPKNPWWSRLPEPKPYPEVSGTYDKRIEELRPEEIIEIAGTAMKEISSYDKRVSLRSGVINSSISKRIIANSNGVYGEDKGTSISMAFVVLAKEKEKVGSFAIGHRESRNLDIDIQELSREVTEKALTSLNARPVKSFKGSLIMGYDVAMQFFATVVAAMCGDNIWKGRSPLANKKGEVIAVENLTIIDDGIMPAGYSSSKFDAEGSPRRRTVLIERGELKSFLHNTYTANILNEEATGNASSLLSVGPSNIDIKPGDYTFEELIEDVKEGILVERFSGHMRFEDGLLSGVAKQAFKIENGKITYPVKECMIFGNVYQMLKQISGMTKERRNCYFVVTPMVKVENITVVSR